MDMKFFQHFYPYAEWKSSFQEVFFLEFFSKQPHGFTLFGQFYIRDIHVNKNISNKLGEL